MDLQVQLEWWALLKHIINCCVSLTSMKEGSDTQASPGIFHKKRMYERHS